MKTLAIGMSLAALAAGGIAHARQDKGSGDMTRAQAQVKATGMFARMDVNKDGKLDEADRAAHLAQMFDRIDTNRNGQITRDEFAAMHEHGPGGAPDQAMTGGGKMGHGDSAGDQTGDRMGKGRHGHGEHGGPGMMMAMARMADTNNDGAISQAEFTAAEMQRFDQADANHDGTLTRAERQAAREQMRAKRHEMHGSGPDAPPSPPAS